MKTYSRKKQNEKDDFSDIPMDINEICRLCLSGEGEMIPIFQTVFIDDVPITTKIMSCISVEVFQGDGLPTQVCQQCVEELNNHYNFKIKCEASDTRLRRYLKNVTRSVELQTSIVVVNPHSLFADIGPDEHQLIQNLKDDLENHRTLAPEFGESESQNEVTELAPVPVPPPRPVPPPQPAPPSQPSQPAPPAEVGQLKVRNLAPSSREPIMKQEEVDIVDAGGSAPPAWLTETERLPFECTHCPKRFNKRLDLRRHQSIHIQQRGFECPVCEKWFPNKTSYGRHERTHTGERPYSCQQCGKSFSQGAILARHLMTHTGVKPFKCDVCHKGFTQREGLRLHMRQHTKDDPQIQLHECPLCEKAFCHPSGLSRHLIIHTGKTFTCDICNKQFTDSSSLRRHMKQRHKEAADQPNQVPGGQKT